MMRAAWFAAFAAGVIAGCESTPFTSSAPSEPGLVEEARSAGWSRADVEAHREAFLAAVSAPSGESVSWSGAGFSGAITAQDTRLRFNGEDSEGKPAPDGIVIGGAMELDQGAHILTSNANVRSGPSTDYDVLATLPAGTRIEAAGRLVREPWVLAAQNGRIRGYIYEELMRQPSGASSRLAGAALATPALCRRLKQQAEGPGGAQEWSSLACRYGGAWRVVGGE